MDVALYALIVAILLLCMGKIRREFHYVPAMIFVVLTVAFLLSRIP